MNSITIVLPLPPRECWQNSHTHYRVRAKHIKAYRAACKTQTTAALRCERPEWEAAKVSFLFYWNDKRRRDPLNAMAAMKAGIDGIVDAGLLIDDDKLTPDGYAADVSTNDPRVHLTFTRVMLPVAKRLGGVA